jgi:hypothetical protein
VSAVASLRFTTITTPHKPGPPPPDPTRAPGFATAFPQPSAPPVRQPCDRVPEKVALQLLLAARTPSHLALPNPSPRNHLQTSTFPVA